MPDKTRRVKEWSTITSPKNKTLFQEIVDCVKARVS